MVCRKLCSPAVLLSCRTITRLVPEPARHVAFFRHRSTCSSSPAIARHSALAGIAGLNRVCRRVRKAVTESDSSLRYFRPPVLIERLDSLRTDLSEN